MANDLAEYIANLDLTLATAVDASTWPDALLTEAIRQGRNAYNRATVYETSFTVTTAGYNQDLSSITDLLDIHAIAYPWQDGLNFSTYVVPWRFYDHLKVYFNHDRPAVTEILRLRHTKLHHIKDLDAAASTTVPAIHSRIVNLAAAAWACLLRQRQITENPGLPRDAYAGLAKLHNEYMDQFYAALHALRPSHNPSWPTYGLV